MSSTAQKFDFFMVGSEENTEIIVVTVGIGLRTDQSVVALFDQPLEDTIKDGPGNATNSVGPLLAEEGNR